MYLHHTTQHILPFSLYKKDGPLPVGRADALNARTQQLLDVIGVIHDLTPLGLKCNTSSTFKDGKFASRDSRWWTGLQNTHFKEFLMIGQPEVEKALINHIGDPTAVEFGISAEGIEEAEDGSYAEVKLSDGRSVKAKYVIAADGAHSPCRKFLEIPFTGVKPNMCWAVLDTFIQTDFPVCPEIISFELNGSTRVAWIPRERGMARFYILLEGEVTQSLAETSIKQHMAPYNVEFTRTEWFSTFNVQERVAETFISPKGRVILAGDSAHVHSVNGGQGLNTGMADAFALVWRLALVLKGVGDTIAVQSYDTERRTTAQTVVNVAAQLVRSTLRTAKEYVEIIEKSAANITGMGITYQPTTPFVVESGFGAFIAGARCPDFTLTSVTDSETIRLYQTVSYGQFIVFNPSSLPVPERIAQLVKQDFVQLWSETHEDNSFVLHNAKTNKKYTTEFELQRQDDGADQQVIVIRPDLYVGYVGVDAVSYFVNFLIHSP